jgi:hypothetical protein
MAPTTFDKFKALYEQPAEMAPDLPTPMKGGNGPRFGANEALVTHVAGTDEVPPPRPKAQRKATPIGPATPLPLDPEMVARVVAFAVEREAIRAHKEAGQPPPWTTDPILATGYFCNVHRENDRVSRWISQNWRDPRRNDPDLWFAMAVARCINEPDALAEIGYPVPFDPDRVRGILKARQTRGEKVFRTDAYKPPTPPDKDTNTAPFLVNDVLGPLWRDREQLRPQVSETLRAYSDRLRERYRIGPFLAGQVIADLKHVEPLRSASDWWTFAVPGPGSQRGLNRVCKREIKASWSEAVWHATLLQLGTEIAPQLEASGIARLDAQNLQNVLCEADKYFRAQEKGGKPSRKYKPAKAPKSTRAKKAPTAAKPDVKPQGNPLTQRLEPRVAAIEAVLPRVTGSPVAPAGELPSEQQRTQPESAKFSNDLDKAPNSTTSMTAAAEPPSYILDPESDAKGASPATSAESRPATTTEPPPASPPPGGNAGGNGAWRASGSKSEAERDTYAKDHACEPFNDAFLLQRGYQLARVFDYTLPDGTPLYQQNRYELKPGIPPLKERPRKRFLTHRRINGAEVFGAGDRRVIYNWPAIMRAGPGRFVFVPEGENKAKALGDVGLLATTVLSHEWAPECVAALTGHHLIILADHDKEGERLASDAQRKLASVAASTRIVSAPFLWKQLPGDRAPQPHDDVLDWIALGGDPRRLLDICREVPAEGAELDEWDAGELLSSGEPIKPRQWLLARCFCRTFLSGLVAPGDAGKTTLRLTQAVELATGRELLGHHIYQRCRVLVLSLEDDREELRRRLAAICKHHGIDPVELKGWLFCRDLKRVKLATRDKNGERQAGPLDGMLRRAIARTRCDLLILDPFVKLHALAENDNADMDFVCEQLITIAQDCNIAVDSPAHTHKGAITAGDADARRGASAQRDAGRLDYTFTVMSEDEAEKFGIHPDDRKSFVRLDKAKANLTRAIKAEWFKLVSVPLGNVTTLYPDGDDMQAIERWKPPETWGDVSSEALNAILNEMEAEMPTGRRYSGKPQATDRAAWKVVQKYCPTKTEAQCREMIREWIKAGVLFEARYHDPVSRKEEWGLFVDRNKRPQY